MADSNKTSAAYSNRYTVAARGALGDGCDKWLMAISVGLYAAK